MFRFARTALIAGTAATAFAAPALAETPFAAQVIATVSIAAQQMEVELVDHDGFTAGKYVWTVSTGATGFETPTGDYQPTFLSRHHRSRQYNNAPMPFAVFFHNGYAVHATFETDRLGQPASHGCVRLSPENAEAFFDLVRATGMENTEIVIVN